MGKPLDTYRVWYFGPDAETGQRTILDIVECDTIRCAYRLGRTWRRHQLPECNDFAAEQLVGYRGRDGRVRVTGTRPASQLQRALAALGRPTPATPEEVRTALEAIIAEQVAANAATDRRA